jgi:hydrogenase maturation protease
MCDSSWRKQLASKLGATSPRTSDASLRLALVGIGSVLRGDDAFGVALVKRLRPLFTGQEDVLVLNAGSVPESASGPLRRFAPDLVILIDAARFGGQPGEISLLDWKEAEGFSASTHSLPLGMVAGFLEFELGCEVMLVGVEPEQLGFGLKLSKPVRAALEELVSGLRALAGG